MHRYLPNLYVFLDQYNNKIFENNNINIGIIYRNYEDSNREQELIKIARACKKKRFQFFVSNDLKLALKAKANGIYIPSFNKSKKFLNLEMKNFTILGSAHNYKEIQEKISQRCRGIFISPIFNTEKSRTYLDIYKFNSLSNIRKIHVLALGGIKEKNIRKLKMLTNIKGFGAIRVFKKKPALKRPVFLKNKFF